MRGGGAHLLQRVDCLLRLALLQHSEHGIYYDNGKDYHRVGGKSALSGHMSLVDRRYRAYRRRDYEYYYHRVGELRQKTTDKRCPLRLCELVSAVTPEPELRLLRRQTLLRAAELLEHCGELFKIVFQNYPPVRVIVCSSG